MNIYKKREGRYPSKKNCRNCLLSEKHIHNLSKKQKDNEIQHHKTVGTQMPNLWKGTICTNLLLSKASKDMLEPLVSMFFPILGEHISGAEFQYSDLSWKELCDQMAYLMDKSGGNKQRMKRGKRPGAGLELS